MSAFSNIFEIALLDHIFHYDVYTFPRTAMVVALWIGSPTDTGSGGAEVSGGDYVRVLTTPSDWSAALLGSIDNSNMISFNEATASWGEITHFGLFNTTEDMLFYGLLTAPVTITTGQVAIFPPYQLAVTLW